MDSDELIRIDLTLVIDRCIFAGKYKTLNHRIMSKIQPYKGLLWTERIWASLVIGTLLFLAIGEFIEEIQNQSLSPFVTLFCGNFLFWLPWIIAAVGYIIAYWREEIGGGISFICFIIIFYPFHFVGNDIFLVVLSSFSSVLYLIYGWSAYRFYKQQNSVMYKHSGFNQAGAKFETQNPKCEVQIISDCRLQTSDLNWLPLLDLNQRPSD